MSERIIKIEPFKAYDNVIILKAKVVVGDKEIAIPESRNLNLYNYDFGDSTLSPREYDNFNIVLSLKWKDGISPATLASLLAPSENPTETLAVRLQVICERPRWSSEQKKIEIGSITSRAALNFDIPLNEVRDKLTIVGHITREIEGVNAPDNVYTSKLSILSTCKELSIQIDELKDIGGEHLPIQPGNIGDLAFDFRGLDNNYDLPTIVFSEDLKEYLTRDDINSVNSSMLTIMFYFLDRYLRWTIFTCSIDTNDRYHKGIIDLFSKLCSVSKEEILEIAELPKYSEEQAKAYVDLSDKMFKGVQQINKYKRELKAIYKLG